MRHARDVSLADVLPSAAAALGVPGFRDVLGIGESSCVVVVLVDGLGATAVEKHPDLFPVLLSARGGSIEAAFPTTTATGLASLGTGLHPGRHGVLGASFLLPETGALLSPLHWGSDPAPVMVQPEPTVFERAAGSNVTTLAVGPAAYAGSGLTHAVLRGADYQHAEDIDERVDAIAQIAAKGDRTLAYVYWPALDRAGHESGPDSDTWREAAGDVNTLLTRLGAALPSDGKLIVTADHGMVECAERIWIDDEPLLMTGVDAIAGEPRLRYLYVDADHVPDVRNRWEQFLGNRVTVLTRDEAVAEGLFGRVDDALVDRIGDLVVVCQGGTCLASRRADPRLSLLPGQHGGLTDDERRIPGLILDA